MKKFILSYIWGFLLLTQIVLVFVFAKISEDRISVITYTGLVTWGLSAVFGWLPIFIFKRKAGVPKGKSFVNTTILVKDGLYALVRHPQYTAGILFSLALILISQNCFIVVIGVVAMVLMYIDIIVADKHEITKFGDDYKQYMREVPRVNFLLGIIRLLRQRKNTQDK